MTTPWGLSAAVIGATLIDELVNQGVRDIVISPGSRSTPLAIAAARNRKLTIHVRIDERSAGFFAIGLVKGQRLHSIERPVALLCSSGTAVANYAPAVQEASASGISLIVLTADRPEPLHGIGANQTIDQQAFFGSAVRWFGNVANPGPSPEAGNYLRRVAARAFHGALGSNSTFAGPVHLNVQLGEPLLQSNVYEQPLPGISPRIHHADPAPLGPEFEIVGLLSATRRVLIIAGEGTSGRDQACIAAQAERLGWPVIAEPSSGARKSSACITMGTWLTSLPAFSANHAPEVVIVTGHPTLSREVLTLLTRAREVIHIDPWAAHWNVEGRATHIIHGHLADLLDAIEVEPNYAWLDVWQRAEEVAQVALRDILTGDESDYTAMEHVLDYLKGLGQPSLLMAAASTPIRTLDQLMGTSCSSHVLTNRGVSGIDGFISTVLGASVGSYLPTVAVVGDLSFMHDMGGLLADVPDGVDITFVVLNNDGGALFSRLPHLQGVDRDVFERLFTTPHGRSPAKIATALGWPATTISRVGDLGATFASMPRTSPIRVIEVVCDAEAARETMILVRETIAANLNPEENSSM